MNMLDIDQNFQVGSSIEPEHRHGLDVGLIDPFSREFVNTNAL